MGVVKEIPGNDASARVVGKPGNPEKRRGVVEARRARISRASPPGGPEFGTSPGDWGGIVDVRSLRAGGQCPAKSARPPWRAQGFGVSLENPAVVLNGSSSSSTVIVCVL